MVKYLVGESFCEDGASGQLGSGLTFLSIALSPWNLANIPDVCSEPVWGASWPPWETCPLCLLGTAEIFLGVVGFVHSVRDRLLMLFLSANRHVWGHTRQCSGLTPGGIQGPYGVLDGTWINRMQGQHPDRFPILCT